MGWVSTGCVSAGWVSAGAVSVSTGADAVSAGALWEALSPQAQMWLRLRLRPSTSVVSASSSVSWPVMTQKWSTADGLSVLATVMAPAFWNVAVRWPESPWRARQDEVPGDLTGLELEPAAVLALEVRIVPARPLVRGMEIRGEDAGWGEDRRSKECTDREPPRDPELPVHLVPCL